MDTDVPTRWVCARTKASGFHHHGVGKLPARHRTGRLPNDRCARNTRTQRTPHLAVREQCSLARRAATRPIRRPARPRTSLLTDQIPPQRRPMQAPSRFCVWLFSCCLTLTISSGTDRRDACVLCKRRDGTYRLLDRHVMQQWNYHLPSDSSLHVPSRSHETTASNTESSINITPRARASASSASILV